MYFNAYPAIWEKITTKASLKKAFAEGHNPEFTLTDMQYSGRTTTIQELPKGAKLSVTNHPKRSWFATVELVNGKVKVS